MTVEVNSSDRQRSATTCLLLPGKILDLVKSEHSAIVVTKLVLYREFEILEEIGLGVMTCTKLNQGANMVGGDAPVLHCHIYPALP